MLVFYQSLKTYIIRSIEPNQYSKISKHYVFVFFPEMFYPEVLKGTKTTAIPNVTDKNAVKNQSPPV